MENNNYKSLAQRLLQDGILSSDNKGIENGIEKPIENPIAQKEDKIKKRINQYDLELLKDLKTKDIINFQTVASLNLLEGFLKSKYKKSKNKPTKIENLFFKLFPKLYKAKLVKDALNELLEHDVDAKVLLDKTIPYGEAQMRYEDLIKYLSFVYEIQTNLKKKI